MLARKHNPAAVPLRAFAPILGHRRLVLGSVRLAACSVAAVAIDSTPPGADRTGQPGGAASVTPSRPGSPPLNVITYLRRSKSGKQTLIPITHHEQALDLIDPRPLRRHGPRSRPAPPAAAIPPVSLRPSRRLRRRRPHLPRLPPVRPRSRRRHHRHRPRLARCLEIPSGRSGELHRKILIMLTAAGAGRFRGNVRFCRITRRGPALPAPAQARRTAAVRDN